MFKFLGIITLVIFSGIYIYATFGLYIGRSMHNDFELNWLWKVPLTPLYCIIMYIIQGIDEGLAYLKSMTK